MEAKTRAAKLATWTTKLSKTEPTWARKPSPGGVPHRLWGTVRWGTPGSRAKKFDKKSNATKKRGYLHSAPPFFPKKWPTWPQVGSQDGAEIDKKSIQKSIKKLMPLGIGFY